MKLPAAARALALVSAASPPLPVAAQSSPTVKWTADLVTDETAPSLGNGVTVFGDKLFVVGRNGDVSRLMLGNGTVDGTFSAFGNATTDDAVTSMTTLAVDSSDKAAYGLQRVVIGANGTTAEQHFVQFITLPGMDSVFRKGPLPAPLVGQPAARYETIYATCYDEDTDTIYVVAHSEANSIDFVQNVTGRGKPSSPSCANTGCYFGTSEGGIFWLSGDGYVGSPPLTLTELDTTKMAGDLSFSPPLTVAGNSYIWFLSAEGILYCWEQTGGSESGVFVDDPALITRLGEAWSGAKDIKAIVLSENNGYLYVTSGRKVYAVCNIGISYCTAGQVVWETPESSAVKGKPVAVADGNVYDVDYSESRVYGYDGETGAGAPWNGFARDEDTSGSHAQIDTDVNGDGMTTLYYAQGSGTIVALDIPEAVAAPIPLPTRPPTNAPTAFSGKPQRPAVMWTRSLPADGEMARIGNGVTVHGERLFVVSGDGVVHRHLLSDGSRDGNFSTFDSGASESSSSLFLDPDGGARAAFGLRREVASSVYEYYVQFITLPQMESIFLKGPLPAPLVGQPVARFDTIYATCYDEATDTIYAIAYSESNSIDSEESVTGRGRPSSITCGNVACYFGTSAGGIFSLTGDGNVGSPPLALTELGTTKVAGDLSFAPPVAAAGASYIWFLSAEGILYSWVQTDGSESGVFVDDPASITRLGEAYSGAANVNAIVSSQDTGYLYVTTGRKVYAVCNVGVSHCAAGQVAWETPESNAVKVKPVVVADGDVYDVSYDQSKVYGYDAETGEGAWWNYFYRTDDNSGSQAQVDVKVHDDGITTLYYVQNSGAIVALNVTVYAEVTREPTRAPAVSGGTPGPTDAPATPDPTAAPTFAPTSAPTETPSAAASVSNLFLGISVGGVIAMMGFFNY